MVAQTIDSMTFEPAHPDIDKRTSISGILLSTAMLLTGVLAFVSIMDMPDKSSTISMACMVIGTALILSGIFRLFWKAKELVYLPTGSAAKECSLFFDSKYQNSLVKMIETGNFRNDEPIKSNVSGSIRMDAILSRDNKFAAVQLLEFIPYTYTPITTVHYFTGSAAADVSTFWLQCRKS